MSECGVCVGGFDGDGPELSTQDVVCARKPHQCDECRQPIVRGQKYCRLRGKWDGSFDSFSFCLSCVEIQGAFSCGGGGSIEIGMLWADMREYVFPELTTANKCFQKLSAESKQVLLDRWKKWKGLA